MGWKSLKERFGITHIVQVNGKNLFIGSGYVHDLVTIDILTGKVTENSTFKRFLLETYPDLLKAPPEEIISLLEKQDTFTHSIAVYTYDGSNIIEKQCENPGWPNVTHDGLVMYDNTFSTNKEEVVSWAKRSAKLGVKCTLERIKDVEEKLRTLRVQLDEYKSDQLKLDAKYQ
jgi:hypothetical protein